MGIIRNPFKRTQKAPGITVAGEQVHKAVAALNRAPVDLRQEFSGFRYEPTPNKNRIQLSTATVEKLRNTRKTVKKIRITD